MTQKSGQAPVVSGSLFARFSSTSRALITEEVVDAEIARLQGELEARTVVR